MKDYMKVTNFIFLITFLVPGIIQGMITSKNFVPKLREKFAEYITEDGYLKVPSPTLAYIFHEGSELLVQKFLGDNERFAHLNVPQVLLDYSFKVSTEIIKKEIEYCSQGYFVFYHGQKLDHKLLQDLKEFFYELKEKKKLKDFIFVRQINSQTLESISKYKNTSQYLRNFFKEYGSDDCSEVSETLLPANYCFFGNSINIGESSFAYFILRMLFPTKIIMNQIKALFLQENKILEFELIKSRLQELVHILNDEREDDHTDNLLQIFLPNTLANLIYFALPYGYKYKCNCLKKILSKCVFGKSFDCDCDFNKLCQRYQVQPNIKMSSIDAEQIRIMLKPEIFMNPGIGMKIFSYTNETEKIKQYNSKIEQIKNFISQGKQEPKFISAKL